MKKYQILLATGNKHKLSELQQLLQHPILELITPDMLGVPWEPPEETATDFTGNARIKAHYGLELLRGTPYAGASVLGEDSGLCVYALSTDRMAVAPPPGVRSARYAGENATAKENVALLLRNLEERAEGGDHDRRGYFHTSLFLLGPLADLLPKQGSLLQVSVRVFTGVCTGTIMRSPEGESGFGYDPVFQPAGFDTVFACLPPEIKARVSHRANATRNFLTNIDLALGRLLQENP